MKLTPDQIAFYIIFIICVLGIGYYYSLNTLNNTEGFVDESGSQTNSQTTNATLSSQPSPSSQSSPSSLMNLQVENELEKIDIKDTPTKNKIINYLTNLNSILDRYKTIEIPVSVNNNGNICENWDMYDNGKYQADGNNCITIKGKGVPKCLDDNILVSCSNYYNDGEIDKLQSINIKDIADSVKYNIMVELGTINADLNKKSNDINNILNELISKRNQENQQLYFIDYNNNNLDDKKKIFNKYNKEFEKSENDVTINKIQFQEFLKRNVSLNEQKDNYYNYIIWLIILLIIVGLLNLFFTELL